MGENKKWEEKYRILEEKYQKLKFQFTLDRRNRPSNVKSEKNSAFMTGYQPAKLVQINGRKPKNLKVTLPTAIQSTNFAPMPSNATPVNVSKSTAESSTVSESFCINDFMKVDTPTAKHVEKMALTGQDAFFTLFDLKKMCLIHLIYMIFLNSLFMK